VVRVTSPGDDHDGKTGTVRRIFDDGDVHVKFGFFDLYRFGRDELRPDRQ
jgi:hypothetical protein